MDIVLIEDVVKYDNDRLNIEIKINNYTEGMKKFKVLLEMPFKNYIENINPTPEKVENGWIIWNINKLQPLEKRNLTFELKGLDKDQYDENDIYVDGLNPIYLVGAEPWHGIE
jgi:hypothetical protein